MLRASVGLEKLPDLREAGEKIPLEWALGEKMLLRSLL
jgi:hypothetical protein